MESEYQKCMMSISVTQRISALFRHAVWMTSWSYSRPCLVHELINGVHVTIIIIGKPSRVRNRITQIHKVSGFDLLQPNHQLYIGLQYGSRLQLTMHFATNDD